MNISIISVQNLQKIFATIAVFAMVFSPFANVQFAHAAKPAGANYLINGSLIQNGLQINASGIASADTYIGQPDNQFISINWDFGGPSAAWVQLADDSTLNFDPLNNGVGGVILNTPWSSSHTYPAPGTYTIKALIHHSTPTGAESGAQVFTQTVTITYQCSDGVDNDSPADGFVDFPADPGCTSATDDSEFNAPVQTAVLVVNKVLPNDSGSTATANQFTFAVNGGTPVAFEADGSNNVSLPVGTVYTVTEPTATGFTTTLSAGCTGTITAQGATCTITNNDNPATLTLIKNKVGGSALATAWTLSAAGPTPITGVTGAGSVTGAAVNAGTYALSESPVVALYSPSDWQCTGATVTGGNQITLANGDSATCTITNTYTPTHGTLTVLKAFGSLFGASFPVNDFSFSTTTGSLTKNFAVGGVVLSLLADAAYSIVESTLPFGFDVAQYSPDCVGSVSAGGSKACTVTNSGIQPKLTLKKTVINDEPARYAGTALESAFTLTATGSTTISGIEGAGSVTNAGVNVGKYVISETGPTSGYNASYACVKNGGATTTASTITLALGDVATCTIINDDKDPTTSLVGFTKTVVGGYNLPDQLPSAFSFDVVGSSNDVDTTVDHAGSLELGVGTYTITEVGPTAGYAATFGGACAGGTLTVGAGDLGGPLSCTITNTELPACSNGINDDGLEDALVDSADPGCTGLTDDTEGDPASSIIIKKVVTGSGSNPDASFEFDVSWSTTNLFVSQNSPATTSPLTPAEYVISEGAAAGYRFVSASCDSNSGTERDMDKNKFNPSVTVILGVGEKITCTFVNALRDTNGELPDRISVDKVVTEGSDGTVPFEFEVRQLTGETSTLEDTLVVSANGGIVSSKELNADEYYSVVETDLPSGWNQLKEVICASSQNSERQIDSSRFLLNDGETITCTFTNHQEPPVCEIGDNLLLNASFEDPVADANIFGSGAWEIFDTVANWASSVNEIELWNNMFGGASEGEQNVELDGNGGATTISQSVTTIPGAIYELRFDFSARPDTGLVDNNVDALVEGVVLMNASADGSELSGNTWTTYSDTFEATDALTEIAFADKGEQNGLGSLVDNAVLCLVRAPETPNYSQGSYGGGGGSSSGSRRKRPVDTPVPQVLGEATSVMPVGAPNTGAGGSSHDATLPSLVLALTATRTGLRKAK